MDADQGAGRQPKSAEGPEAAEVSEGLGEDVGGEGATPVGSSDQHSAAPGPHGLGPLTDDPEAEEAEGRVAPLEPEPDADG
jgi:hypothetical protein